MDSLVDKKMAASYDRRALARLVGNWEVQAAVHRCTKRCRLPNWSTSSGPNAVDTLECGHPFQPRFLQLYPFGLSP